MLMVVFNIRYDFLLVFYNELVILIGTILEIYAVSQQNHNPKKKKKLTRR